MAQVTRSITIKGSVEHIYDLWTKFENFPHFMKHIKAVTITGPATSHWVMEGPLGFKVDWNAEMTRNEANKRIAWNSKDASGMVTVSGEVSFNSLPNDETKVTAVVQYTPPGGKAGEFFANAFGKPEERVAEDLRHFKTFAEGKHRVSHE